MLRSEAITIIKRGLGFRQTQDAAIVAALKQIQRDLEHGKTLPSWLLVFDVAIPVTADATTVSLPTGFLRFHEDYPPFFVNSDGDVVNVPRRTSDEAIAAYGSDDSGEARVFVQRNATTIELVPPFTADTTMYLTYYKAADVLDSEIENAWLANAANYLVGLAGVQVAGDLRDKGAMDKFSLMAKMGNAAYIGSVIDEELAGRPLIMGRNN
jgi:hypothetical protein